MIDSWFVHRNNMDLFSVNRYMGDDEDEGRSPDKEKSRLRQLCLEVEERKRKSEGTEHSVVDARASAEIQTRKKTKYAGKKEVQCEYMTSIPEPDQKSRRKAEKRKLRLKVAEEMTATNGFVSSEGNFGGAQENSKGAPKGKDRKEFAQSKGAGEVKSAKSSKHKKSELYDNERGSRSAGEVEAGANAADEPGHTDAEEALSTAGYTVIGGNKKGPQIKKVQHLLPEWLAKPTVVDADLRGDLLQVDQLSCLNEQLIKKLKQQNMTHFFPVQSKVIPAILSQDIHGYQPGDLCVSAPTGSGKTLAYVLPIVQSLMGRVVCHLQALVLLPTKDLANQVKQVFDSFTSGTKVKVGLASGTKSFAKEQETITCQNFGGSMSQVDILVATPGRLVDHITSTPNFTLEHLRFLVIDEADRLLDQSYHGWLGKVLKAAYKTEHVNYTRSSHCQLQSVRHPPVVQTAMCMFCVQLPLQKLLFSATMTHSPEKLAPLQLYRPVLFMVTKSGDLENGQGGSEESLSWYSTPSGLTEYMLVCNSGEKPLVVLHFLTQLKFQNVLCFASSVESTHRLYLLIKLYGGIAVAEYSSSLTAQQRRAILRDFRAGSVQLLICSDAMARGMDIDSVQYVISYDAPNYAKGYIHRVGRTARAGNKGTAITLLHKEEAHHFKELIRKTGREKIAKFRVKDDELHPLIPGYQDSLTRLQDVLAQEHQKQKQPREKAQVLKYLQQQIKDNLISTGKDLQ